MTKYVVKNTSMFKKNLKKLSKQNMDLDKLFNTIEKLANGEKLGINYRVHKLEDCREYKNCYECHIKGDWLLIYKYVDNDLVLLLVNSGTHSELFKIEFLK